MQKLGNKASILLWSIFLSMTLIIAFTSINYQLRKNLSENAALANSISNNNTKLNAINNSIKNNDFSQVKLDNNEKIIFEGDNIINKGFKNEEHISLKIAENKSTNMTIKIISGGPVFYSNSFIEGLVTKESTFNTKTGGIEIKNLGGYSSVIITSENKFENLFKKYKIVTDYGARVILKEKGEITLK